ncbi:MAG TPA: hypothetical protein VFY43_05990 [Candidatus Limnocylindria bacterium]|nr:hypothetical protein [Candidatus Limnocylindria bacterium]
MTQVQRAGLQALTRLIGERRANQLADLYRRWILVPAEALTYGLSGRGRWSRRRLAELAGAYAGKRCFIIGNGPSLQGMDLTRLRGEHTFGLNRGYLLFDRIGAPTTFLVSVNDHVVRQFGADLVAAGLPLFVSWRARRWVPRTGDPIFIKRGRPFSFSSDIAGDGAWEGATVTFVAMQLAFHMGFAEVILIGVDHSFSSTGPANKLVTSQGTDPNHFDPSYFGPGVQWQLPDLEMSEVAYRLARDQFAQHGRTIVDATVDGRLDVFPKASYDALTRTPPMGQ